MGFPIDVAQGLSRALGPIVDLMFPPRCPLCGESVARHGGLCIDCWGKLEIPGEPACRLCQRPLGDRWIDPDPSSEDGPNAGMVCAPCLIAPPRHDGIAAATLYTDGSRRLVLSLKHGRRIGLAALMARLMIARLPPLAGEWLVVPVPLHRWRLWQRGYNQSVLLAAPIARATRQQLLVDGLVRIKRTPSLGGLSAEGRTRALQGAIAPHPRHRHRFAGAQVLLVDDVLTSGATTQACVRTLRQAGAARVKIACFARVLREARGRPSGNADTETPGP